MSRRTLPRSLVLVLVLTALGSGCVFSPKTAPEPPPVVIKPAESPDQLIDNLRLAYLNRDIVLFTSLFPPDGIGVNYTFILNEPDPITGDTDWGRTEEIKVHRRMFDPENPQPGESQVPPEYWLQSISMSLTPIRAFELRTGLGLPPKWKVWEGQYHPNITFDLQGQTDYTVDGRANFLVIEDTELPTGTEGKFLIYIWEDLGAFKPAANPA